MFDRPSLRAHLVQQEDILCHQLAQLRNVALGPQEHMLHKERNGENAIPLGSVERGVPHSALTKAPETNEEGQGGSSKAQGLKDKKRTGHEGG